MKRDRALAWSLLLVAALVVSGTHPSLGAPAVLWQEASTKPSIWPSRVTTVTEAHLTITTAKGTRGSISLPKGTEAEVLGVEGEQLRVRIDFFEGLIAPTSTDFLEACFTIKRDQLRAQALVKRAELIAESHKLSSPTTTLPPSKPQPESPKPASPSAPPTASTKPDGLLLPGTLQLVPQVLALVEKRREGEPQAVAALLALARGSDENVALQATFVLARWVQAGEGEVIDFLRAASRNQEAPKLLRASRIGLHQASMEGNGVAGAIIGAVPKSKN